MEAVEILFERHGGRGPGDKNKNRLRRVKTPNGEGVRFLLVDVVKLMGLKSNVTTVGNRLDKEDVFREEILTGGGTQTVITVNVMGLLQTVLGARCKSEEAKCLHQWIRENILASTDLFVEEVQQKKKKPTKKRKKQSPHPTNDKDEEDNFALMAITFEKQYDQEAVVTFAREYQEQYPDRVLQASVCLVSYDEEEKGERSFPPNEDDDSREVPQLWSRRQGKRKRDDLPPTKNDGKEKRTKHASANEGGPMTTTTTTKHQQEKILDEAPSPPTTRKRKGTHGATPPRQNLSPSRTHSPPALKRSERAAPSRQSPPGGKRNTKGHYQQHQRHSPPTPDSPFSSPPDHGSAPPDHDRTPPIPVDEAGDDEEEKNKDKDEDKVNSQKTTKTLVRVGSAFTPAHYRLPTVKTTGVPHKIFFWA